MYVCVWAWFIWLMIGPCKILIKAVKIKNDNIKVDNKEMYVCMWACSCGSRQRPVGSHKHSNASWSSTNKDWNFLSYLPVVLSASQPVSQSHHDLPDVRAAAAGTTNDKLVNAALSNCTQTNLFDLQSVMTAERWELFRQDFSQPRYLASNDHVAMATHSTREVQGTGCHGREEASLCRRKQRHTCATPELGTGL